MPLIINGKVFSDPRADTLKRAKQALYTAPHPTLIPYDDNLGITEHEIVQFQEGEMAYHNDVKTPEKINYLATVQSYQCLNVFLESDHDHLGLHVGNPNVKLNFDELIAKFQSKNGLKVTILGGVPCEASEKLLNLILIRLIESKNNFTLKAQQAVEHNPLLEKFKHYPIRDRLLEKLGIIYKDLYGKNIDYSLYKACKSTDFFTKPTEAGVQKALKLMMMQLALTSQLPDPEYAAAAKDNMKLLRKIVGEDELMFYTLSIEIFTKDGFDLANDYFKFTAGPELTNFALNIKTGNIHHTSFLIPTPHHSLRILQKIDPTTGQELILAFDGVNYTQPSISNLMKTQLEKLQPILQRGSITKNEITVIERMLPGVTNNYLVLMELCDAARNYFQQESKSTAAPLLTQHNNTTSETVIAATQTKAPTALRKI